VPRPDGRPDPLFASGGGWARTGASRPGGPRGSCDFGRIAINAPTGPANAPSGSARASDHFAPLRVQSQPAIKIPPAPEPQKGEQPLGKIKDRLTGADVPIYASLVPSGGLWLFNGGSPKLAALYPSSNEFSLANLGKGGFALKVTAGSDKASLAGGGAALTGKDLDKITIQAIGPSKKHDDVKIEIKHRAPGAKSDTSLDLTLEVKAPDHLKLLGTNHSPAEKVGYLSLTSLQEIIEATRVDGAVLDIHLNGTSTSYPVAAALESRRIPFLFVTGVDKRRMASLFPSAAVIYKPFAPAQLQAAVTSVVAKAF
jgi:hypothetical protein